jgi:hypothetical protein
MFPLSDDDDLNNDYDTFFGPSRLRKSGTICSGWTQYTHTTTNTDCLSDLLGPIHRGQSTLNTNRNKPQLERTYEEIHLMKTKSDNTVKPRCNFLTCPFNRGHYNINPDNFRKHLMKCDEREKVKGVRGKSYAKVSVYKSTIYPDMGHQEICKYDSRHHILSSDTKSHCGECCRMICKRGNNA